MTDAEKRRREQLAEATEALGYEVHSPPAPQARDEMPHWMLPDDGRPEDAAIQRILQEEWPVALIRKQIRKLGIKPHGRSRLDLATQLVETFMDPHRLQAVVDNLSDAAQTYYVQMLFNLRLPRRYDQQAGETHLVQVPDVPVEPLLNEILDAGLMFRRDDRMLVHTMVMSRIPALHLSLPSSASVPEPDDPTVAQPLHTVQQIQQLLGLVRAQQERLRPEHRWRRQPAQYMSQLSAGLPTPEDARRINQAAWSEQLNLRLMAPEPRLAPETLTRWAEIFDGDADAAELMYHLLRAVGVLRPGSPITLEPGVTESFLALAPGRQLALLLNYSVIMGRYDPFWPLWRAGRVEVRWQYRPPYHGLQQYDHFMAQALYQLSVRVLELLALLPSDRWLSLDTARDLAHRLPLSNPAYLFGPVRFWDTQGEVQGFLDHYVRVVIERLLWRLGMSDLAHTEAGEVRAFRLHALQDLLWGRREALPMSTVTWEAAQAVRWVAEPPGMALSPPVPVDVLRQVQRWAEPEGVEAGALRYTLDLRRLYEVFKAGEHAESLAAAWEQAAGVPAPEPLADWWSHWWARYGHVQLYPRQALLEVQDEFTMHELQVAVPALRGALLAQLTPRAALVRRDQVAPLMEQMEAQGYMPKLVSLTSSEGER